MGAQVEARSGRVNGVGLEALLERVASIRARSELGRCRFRALNQWLDGGHTRTTVRDFYGAGAEQTGRALPVTVESDAPGLFAGDDRAMDPLEHLLGALAASFTTTLVWHAAACGVHIDGIETAIEGEIDLRGCLGLERGIRPGFEAVRMCVSIEAEADNAELDQLVALAARLSPVLDTVRLGTAVSVQRCPTRS